MKKSLILFINIFLFCLNLNSQSNKLIINVKNKNDKSISGAVILFDDVKQNRWTNSSGIFKTKLKKQPKEIAAFHPKYGIKKIKYSGQKEITIKIESDNYSISNSPKQRTGAPNQFNDIYDYLRSRVAGLNISSDNIITIRGFNTVNGNTEPLFILNDLNVDKDTFGSIVVNDIKSISVLKGPETSRYGVRGANGVIIVKTL